MFQVGFMTLTYLKTKPIANMHKNGNKELKWWGISLESVSHHPRITATGATTCSRKEDSMGVSRGVWGTTAMATGDTFDVD